MGLKSQAVRGMPIRMLLERKNGIEVLIHPSCLLGTTMPDPPRSRQQTACIPGRNLPYVPESFAWPRYARLLQDLLHAQSENGICTVIYVNY